MASIQLSEIDQGTSVNARIGDTIVIRLKENPTTGYRWASAEAGDPVLALHQSEHVPQQDGAIGAGGFRALTYQVHAAGIGRIQLKRLRPWLGDESIVARFEVNVNATE